MVNTSEEFVVKPEDSSARCLRIFYVFRLLHLLDRGLQTVNVLLLDIVAFPDLLQAVRQFFVRHALALQCLVDQSLQEFPKAGRKKHGND